MSPTGRKIYVALDIGSNSVKLVVSEYMNTKHSILCAYAMPSQGVRNGIVTNPIAVTNTIQKLISKAQLFLGFPISKVVVAIPAVYNRLTTIDNRDVYSEERVISGQLIQSLIDKTIKMVRLPNEEVVNFIPFSFSVDGGFRTDNPRDHKGKNLSVSGMIVTTPKDVLFDILKCVEEAGLEIVNIFPAFYAGAKVTFLDSELRQGALYINLGHDATTILSIRNNEVRKLKTIKMGVNVLINDLVQVFKVSEEDAAKMIHYYGSATTKETSDMATCEVYDTDKNEMLTLSEQEISEVIYVRLKEMLELISNEFDYFEVNDKTKVTLTGGLTNLVDFKAVADEVFEYETNIYIPEYIGARDATYTTAIGLIDLQTHFEKLYDVSNVYTAPSAVRVQQNVEYSGDVTGNYDMTLSEATESAAPEKKQNTVFRRIMNMFYEKSDE